MMPIKTFADHTTADIYNSIDSKAARRIDKNAWNVARRKLNLLASAATTRDLSQVPGNYFESLKHDRPGFYSIRINDNLRLIFRFENGDAYDVSIENYHGRKTT